MVTDRIYCKGYMMEDLETSSASTLIYRQKESDKDSPKKSNTSMSQSSEDTKQSTAKKEEDVDNDKLVPLATFRSWKKLPHRVSLWVFQFDPSNPSDLKVSEDGGFPRPDLLPMADIFRSDE